MVRFGRVLVAAMVLTLAALARPAGADPQSCDFFIAGFPAFLASPGTYCLTEDRTFGADGAAVTIEASDVTIDLQGFTLSGTAGPGHVAKGIWASVGDRATVTNGTVAGFYYGVQLASGRGHQILDVRAEGSWYLGLAVGNGGAIRDCVVVGTGGSTFPEATIPIGIKAVGDAVAVTDNFVGDMTPPPGGEAIGISLDEGVGGVVARNVIANPEVSSDTWGVWNLGTASAITDNLVIRFEHAIAFAPPSSGTFSGNTFFNVTSPVVLGVKDAFDGGNAIVHSSCEPIYAVPFVITHQGNYCLVRNLSTPMASGAAILVDSDYVRLDLRGFKIGGGSAGPASLAIGVRAVNRRNVTVASGNVRGFWKGVSLEGGPAASGYRVEGILADGNINAGIDVDGSSAAVLRNQVVETTGSDGGGTCGIRVAGPLARVLGNEVSGTSSGATACGVSVTGGGGAVVDGNRISAGVASSSTGIVLQSARDAVVTRNRVLGTGVGIAFSSSTGRYRDNLTMGVTTPYLGGTNAGANN